jgi:hypothetical protein
MDTSVLKKSSMPIVGILAQKFLKPAWFVQSYCAPTGVSLQLPGHPGNLKNRAGLL